MDGASDLASISGTASADGSASDALGLRAHPACPSRHRHQPGARGRGRV